jgi:hypothetical protein
MAASAPSPVLQLSDIHQQLESFMHYDTMFKSRHPDESDYLGNLPALLRAVPCHPAEKMAALANWISRTPELGLLKHADTGPGSKLHELSIELARPSQSNAAARLLEVSAQCCQIMLCAQAATQHVHGQGDLGRRICNPRHRQCLY